MNFFRNFLARVEYERNSELKFFFLFLGLFCSILAKNNTGRRFFNCLNFFAIFFVIFLRGLRTNGIRDKIFFLTFSAYLIPFWLKIMPERGFLIFRIFFGIVLPGTSMNGILGKIFFLPFPAYLIPLWLKIMLERGF